MPRCEGRPDGPCPHKVNNSTVINCQSKKRDAKRNAPATRSSANSDRSTKEETLVKPVNSSKHSAVDCIVCREDADEVHISCDICNDCYHKHCSAQDGDEGPLGGRATAIGPQARSGKSRRRFRRLTQ